MTFRKAGKDRPNKSAQVRIRFTPEEKVQAEALAGEAGLTLSEYIRRRALDIPVRSIADDQVINELRRLGGLLKETHKVTGGIHSQATAAALVELTAAIQRIGR